MGFFTGRIVPKVKITWGVPLYDRDPRPCREPGVGHRSINGYGSTATGRIGIFSRPARAAATMAIRLRSTPTRLCRLEAIMTGAIEVKMPRDNTSTLRVERRELSWTMTSSSVAAHSSRAQRRQCKCTYYYDHIDQYNAMYDHSETYTVSTLLQDIPLPPYFDK
jgi:hypothetical protein